MTRTLAIVLAILNVIATAVVWVAWGGIHNDISTLVLLCWLVLSTAVIADNTKKMKKK